MKPLWKGLTAAALAACLCATGVLAAGHHGRGLRYTAGGCGANCVNFADANGDGICDCHGTGCGSYFVDADGDGACDNCGRYFTDANGDGICDNFGTGLGIRRGCGQHGGCRNH